MQGPFTFKHRGLLAWLFAALALSTVISYVWPHEPWPWVLGVVLFALGGALSTRFRGWYFEWPAPNFTQGAIAATGAALFVGHFLGKGVGWLVHGSA